MKKSILVTGACGGMGRAAVDALVNAGYRIFALDLKAGENSDGVIPIEADLSDDRSVKDAFERVKYASL